MSNDYWGKFIPAMRTTRLGDCTDSDPDVAAAWLGWQARDAEIAALKVENERLRVDAKRLQFVCSKMIAVELNADGINHKWIFKNMPMVGANAQAAIDAQLNAHSEGDAT